jgi:hypothetical protein
MKRLLAICLLTFVLSFPAFGGHTQIGGAYCDCNTAGCAEDYRGECSGGYLPMATHQTAPSDPTAELGIVIVALLFWLRLKA